MAKLLAWLEVDVKSGTEDLTKDFSSKRNMSKALTK